MKLYVCTIMRNESAHVTRFLESVAFADDIYVLDTGSTDNSVVLMKACPKAVVSERTYESFRFDTARNDAMATIPAPDGDGDVWILHLDLDEVVRGDVRAAIEEAAAKGANQIGYLMHADGGAGNITYLIDRLHRQGCYTFKHRIHENLYPTEGTRQVAAATNKFGVFHLPDTKKPRSYSKLIEEEAASDPNNLMFQFYHARDLFINGRLGSAADASVRPRHAQGRLGMGCALVHYLALKGMGSATVQALESALLQATLCSPASREPWYMLMHFYASINDMQRAFWAGTHMLGLNVRYYDLVELGEAWSLECVQTMHLICLALGYKDVAATYETLLKKSKEE
jgi:hypothetical protein